MGDNTIIELNTIQFLSLPPSLSFSLSFIFLTVRHSSLVSQSHLLQSALHVVQVGQKSGYILMLVYKITSFYDVESMQCLLAVS